MSPRDYCYWLMGAFELLKPNRSSLTYTRTINEMREHLALVLADTTQSYQTRYPGDCLGMDFCKWLNGWLYTTGSNLSLEQLDDVFERLSMAFIDEIDPSFSNGDQLQDIHDGKAIPASDKFIGT